MMQIRTNSQAWAFRGRAISRIRRAMAFGDAMTSVYTYRTRPSLARVISERKLGRHCFCCAAAVVATRLQIWGSPVTVVTVSLNARNNRYGPCQKHSLPGTCEARRNSLHGLFIAWNPNHLSGINSARVSLSNRYSSHYFWRYRMAILWQS